MMTVLDIQKLNLRNSSEFVAVFPKPRFDEGPRTEVISVRLRVALKK